MNETATAALHYTIGSLERELADVRIDNFQINP